MEELGAHLPVNSKEWLGKLLNLQFEGQEGEDQANYSCHITGVQLDHSKGHHGDLYIQACSSTMAIEMPKTFKSWSDVTLSDIVIPLHYYFL